MNDGFHTVTKHLNWWERFLARGAIRGILGRLKDDENILAAAKGQVMGETFSSYEWLGWALLVVTTQRVFIFIRRENSVLDVPVSELTYLHDVCPSDPVSENHTVELGTKQCVTFRFAVSSKAANEIDQAAQLLYDND